MDEETKIGFWAGYLIISSVLVVVLVIYSGVQAWIGPIMMAIGILAGLFILTLGLHMLKRPDKYKLVIKGTVPINKR